jgi:hypothetical protein
MLVTLIPQTPQSDQTNRSRWSLTIDVASDATFDHVAKQLQMPPSVEVEFSADGETYLESNETLQSVIDLWPSAPQRPLAFVLDMSWLAAEHVAQLLQTGVHRQHVIVRYLLQQQLLDKEQRALFGKWLQQQVQAVQSALRDIIEERSFWQEVQQAVPFLPRWNSVAAPSVAVQSAPPTQISASTACVSRTSKRDVSTWLQSGKPTHRKQLYQYMNANASRTYTVSELAERMSLPEKTISRELSQHPDLFRWMSASSYMLEQEAQRQGIKPISRPQRRKSAV